MAGRIFRGFNRPFAGQIRVGGGGWGFFRVHSPSPLRTPAPSVSGTAISVAAEFFRTTFEIMGYVAKSDGRVSEAEIDAARRLMQEFNLGPADVAAAIACFTTGKSAGYDGGLSVEWLG